MCVSMFTRLDFTWFTDNYITYCDVARVFATANMGADLNSYYK